MRNKMIQKTKNQKQIQLKCVSIFIQEDGLFGQLYNCVVKFEIYNVKYFILEFKYQKSTIPFKVNSNYDLKSIIEFVNEPVTAQSK